jgi:hypothetical protein
MTALVNEKFQVVNAGQLQQALSGLPTGTTIFCHNPNHLVCKIIRTGLNSYWDHTATLVWYDGVPCIVEAKGGERIYPKLLWSWLAERTDNTFMVSPAEVDLKRIESQYGKEYDYKAVLFCMTWYELTGWWIGRTSDKNQDQWFCFELSAWYRNLPEYWNKVPDGVGGFK